ncbi:MAG: hypothetical protein HZA93_24025 [Verrucomicrobia bacterium]|nr:hypothetical protein [Verrucomicrobiota bacterium]
MRRLDFRREPFDPFIEEPGADRKRFPQLAGAGAQRGHHVGVHARVLGKDRRQGRRLGCQQAAGGFDNRRGIG